MRSKFLSLCHLHVFKVCQAFNSFPSIKQFIDVVYDVSPASCNMRNLKAVIPYKAWDELPETLTMKERPTFEFIIGQYFIITQNSGNLCVAKHFYIRMIRSKAPVSAASSAVDFNGR